MRIAVGSDHAGLVLKVLVSARLAELGHVVDDLGTNSETSVDYPDYGAAVGRKVSSRDADLGIAICGTGIGISIAANKIHGVRAAVVHDVTTARLARAHNDANVLCFGARTVGAQTALDSVEVFLSTRFEGGRHERRLSKIESLEEDE